VAFKGSKPSLEKRNLIIDFVLGRSSDHCGVQRVSLTGWGGMSLQVSYSGQVLLVINASQHDGYLGVQVPESHSLNDTA
jgi:hypothetical protein